VSFRALAGELERELSSCVSGLEKRSRQSERDIPLAAALDASRAVPELVDGVYRAS
jgi:hypothetical protein